MHALVDKLTEEENSECYFEALEWHFQMCDEITRRTGRLTKQVLLVAHNHLALCMRGRILSLFFLSPVNQVASDMLKCIVE